MDDKRTIIINFITRVQEELASSFVRAILYGSYARGDFNASSDIDIMVLTTLTDSEIEEIENTIYDFAYDYLLSDGITISVNIKNISEFEYWENTLPYYKNVKKEGIVLAG